ncbi:hypothetical protein DPMN_084552 [Dreissena polymorpha]|uniref:FAS1 domain-containing protein n=1 Tax=Dreissena polymorpha TaxID=45954 RepID=A0A9D3YES1_DREPO|nr:hypothetical protein DPMN_084552 [Dreissena polymorpha]
MGKITFSFILLCICVGLSVARPRRYPGAGHEWRWGKVRGSDKGRHIGASLDPTFGTLMKQNLKMPEDWVRSQRGMMHQTFGNRFEIGPGKFGLGFGGEFRIPEFEMNLNLGSRFFIYRPNVCYMQSEKVENVTEITSHFRFLSFVCDVSDTTHKCIETSHTPRGKIVLTKVYECCFGFMRKRGEFGCQEEILLSSIPDLLKTLGLTELDSVGLSSEVLASDNNNFTVFAPSNEVLAKFVLPALQQHGGVNVMKDIGSVVIVSQEISNSVIEDTRNILLGHVAVGRLTSSRLTDDMIVETASPLKSSIRINTYEQPKKLVTANCKPITSTDNIAINGVVHSPGPYWTWSRRTQNSVSSKQPGRYTLLAPTDAAFKKHVELLTRILGDDKKCMEKLASKKNYSEFLKLLERAGLKKDLALAENITVFVPSNEAMQSLPSNVVAKVTSDVELLKETLKYHVVPDAFSCRALYNNKLLDTLEGTSLRINEYSTFPFGREWLQTVQCASFEAETIKGCNGNILVVNKILSPPTGDLVDVLAMDRRFSYLTTLLKVADIADMLQEEGPFTLFAPTNEVFTRERTWVI